MSRLSPASITTTVADAFQRMVSGPYAIAAVSGLGLVVAAGLIAPGEAPGLWAWIRVLIAASCAGLALAVIDASREPTVAARGRSSHLLISGLFLLITVLLSATFASLTVLIALLVLGLVLLHLNASGPSSLPVLWALLGILIPFWVWSAFDAWDRLLLMLLPLGMVGIISLEHALRADLYGDAIRERYAGWLGIIAMTALLLISGMMASIDTKWVVTGAIAAVILAAVDLAPPRRTMSEAIPSMTLPAIALLALMLTWLVAL